MLLLAAALSLSAALSAPTLAGAHVGALVVDAQTGSVLFERNSNDAFQPASTMKLVVGSAALSLLGPDASLQTAALTDGSIENGTLHGNLYLRGGGDPTVDANAFNDAARAIAGLHVQRIDGELVIDNSAFTAPSYPGGWSVDDLPNDYAAPITALAFNENAVALQVHGANVVGARAVIAPSPQNNTVTIDNEVTTGVASSQDTSELSWPAGVSNAIRVSGSFPIGATDPGELDAAVRDPVAFAGDALREALATQKIASGSIVHEGPTPASARVLWIHHSPPLRDVVSRMWLPSDNFIAEMLLEDFSAANGSGDTRARGIARESDWLRTLGVDPSTMTISDGSGMSQYDRVTPAALVALLRADWNSPNRDAILAALPVAGKSGTLQHSFNGSPLEGVVYAKTGSMMHTRTLAGYITPPNGRVVIFALMVNDWLDVSASSAASMKALQQEFLEAALSS